MSQKIKIAIFTDVLKEGMDGVTHTLFNIINHTPKHRFEFIFITPFPPDDLDSFEYPLYVCKYFRFPLYRDYRVATPGNDEKLEHFLNDFNPDIVHFTTPSLLGRYAVKYARKRNKLLTSTYHTHFISYLDYYFRFLPFIAALSRKIVKRIMLWFYNKCDKIFVPSKPIRDELVTMGINPRLFTIWGRGIDTTFFNPERKSAEFIQSITKSSGVKRILYVGRIVWEKDIKVISELYKKFKHENKNVEFIITGNGPRKKAFAKMMPDAVFTGALYKQDLAKIYASCDLFVFPSTTETFGNVVLEAMASGTPVVVSARGGQAGFVIDGQTGYIAEPKNVNDFYKKINILLTNEHKYKYIQKKGIEYANRQTWEQLTFQLFAEYEKMALSVDSNKNVEELNEITA